MRKIEQYKKLKEVKDYLKKLNNYLMNGKITDELKDILVNMKDVVLMLGQCITDDERMQYEEYFQSFIRFCSCCDKEEFIIENWEMLTDSLQLMEECVAYLAEQREKKYKKCCICSNAVFYEPLSDYYDQMKKIHHTQSHIAETLNKEEYTCPVCGSSDRERLIISFLKKMELQYSGREESVKLLQIAPSVAVETWIKENCPNVEYDSTDLYMDGVTFHSDVQNMSNVKTGTYDIVICSHVLEHVQNDRQAMLELKRILKPDGICIFLVPVCLDIDRDDEEWGLSEEENWKRFDQGDHCRRYSRNGLINRLEEAGFCVHSLGKQYFGEQIFYQAGLIDTSTLYVLSKENCDDIELVKWLKNLYQCELKEKPLVTVLMSVYNHEEFVAEAIESVINQTYKNIEFIVADDASTDKSVEIMKKYEPYFSKVHYYKDNRGGRASELILEANGKYTALMSSDDIWESDKIEKQVRILEANRFLNVCFTWCDYVDKNLSVLQDKIFYQRNRSKEAWMRRMFEYGNCLCHPSILIETNLYSKLLKSGVCAIRQLPDFTMWLRVIQKYEIYIFPEVLVKMRRYNYKGKTNTSAINNVNIYRSLTEQIYIWYDTIKNMDNEYFKSVFGNQFVLSNANTEEEILCEKFFLLKNTNRSSYNMAAILLYFDIYKNDKVVNCLYNKYHFGRKEFWDYYGKFGLIQFAGKNT